MTNRAGASTSTLNAGRGNRSQISKLRGSAVRAAGRRIEGRPGYHVVSRKFEQLFVRKGLKPCSLSGKDFQDPEQSQERCVYRNGIPKRG